MKFLPPAASPIVCEGISPIPRAAIPRAAVSSAEPASSDGKLGLASSDGIGDMPFMEGMYKASCSCSWVAMRDMEGTYEVSCSCRMPTNAAHAAGLRADM